MSELQELSKKINNQDKGNLSDKDILDVANKLNKIQQKGNSESAASKAIEKSFEQIKDVLPNKKSLVSAIMGSTPLLSSVGNMFSKITDTLGSEEPASEVEEMTPEPTKPIQEDNVRLINSADGIRELLEEVVEQLKYSNNLDENILDDNRVSKLAALGNDVEVDAPQGVDMSGLDSLLENQEEQLRLQTLDFLTGSTGITSVLGGLLGSSGLFGVGSKFMTGLKMVGKNGLKVLGPIGLIAGSLLELYDGFTTADEYFGEAVSVPKKIQYAVTRLFTSLIAPIDWAIEAITGEESNIRGFFDKNLLIIQDKIFDYVKPIFEIPLKIFDWVVGFTQGLFEGATADTLISDLPAIMYKNIKTMMADGIKRITPVFEGIIDSAFDALLSLPDKFSSIFNSLNESLKLFFNNTIDSMASGLSGSIGFGIGDSIADKLQGLKFDVNTPSGSNVETTSDKPVVESGIETPSKVIRQEILPVGESRVDEKSRQALMNQVQANEPKNERSNDEPTKGELLVIKAIEEMKQTMKPNQVITSAPITTNNQTTVVKGEMSTFSGVRILRPEF